MTGNANVTPRGSAILAYKGLQYKEQTNKEKDALIESYLFGKSFNDKRTALVDIANGKVKHLQSERIALTSSQIDFNV